MGARVTVVGPPPLIPRGIEALGCAASHSIDAIRDADVVYVLRMQRERMLEGANYVPSLREYTARWGVTAERIRPGQKVMHPGPMNRGVEIDPAVADAADALIERQVRSGLVVRMAVLYDLLTHGPVEVKVAEIEEVAKVLFGGNGRKDDLVLEGIRVVDPTQGIDEILTVTVEKGVITRLEPTAATANGKIVAPAFVD